MRRASFVLALLLLGCSSAGNTDDTTTDDSDITSLPRTAVEDQKETGNCWLYATTAWAEALDTPSGGTAPRYSVSYLVYWNFYDQILASGSGFSGVSWTGGEWEDATSLISRYGTVAHSAFTSSTTTVADANLSLSALDAVNKALKSGTLKTKAARKDPTIVREALNQAFKLSASVVADLDASFGADGAATFEKGAAASGVVIAPSTKLANAMSTYKSSELDPNTPASKHDAAFTTFVRRIQRSLHEGIPVPVEWCVEYTGEDKSGTFDVAISGVQEADCAHETVIVDYQATLADGTVLKAGTQATKAQMAAALADGATVTFLRMKNSWGGDGTTDVYVDYLKSSVESCPSTKVTSSCEDWPFLLDTVVLPPGL